MLAGVLASVTSYKNVVVMFSMISVLTWLFAGCALQGVGRTDLAKEYSLRWFKHEHWKSRQCSNQSKLSQ
jgi:hypothetical protein